MTDTPLRLVSVEFETTLGSVYSFPDMDLNEMESLVSRFTFENNVTLVNLSQACLVLPARVVKSIRIEGVEKWSRPASLV